MNALYNYIIGRKNSSTSYVTDDGVSDAIVNEVVDENGPTNYCPGLPVTARSRNLLPGDKIKTSRVTEQVFLYFKHIFMYVLL